MRIISDITGKEYKTVDECLEAEELFKNEQREKERHQRELDKAYKKAMAAIDEYLELAGVKIHETDDGYTVEYHDEFEGEEAEAIWEDILESFLNF